MDKKRKLSRSCSLIAVSLSLITGLALPVPSQEMPSVRAVGSRPLPPIFTILDADQDGVIAAAEVANAAAALKQLDRNSDGKLTADEYRPQRPEGGMAPKNKAESQSRPEGQGAGRDAERRPPRPPVDLALDPNGDEVIAADEIAAAPALLKKLDDNNDGRLSRDECLPKPPMRQDGQAETAH